jgi:hypothetical protein
VFSVFFMLYSHSLQCVVNPKMAKRTCNYDRISLHGKFPCLFGSSARLNSKRTRRLSLTAERRLCACRKRTQRHTLKSGNDLRPSGIELSGIGIRSHRQNETEGLKEVAWSVPNLMRFPSLAILNERMWFFSASGGKKVYISDIYEYNNNK